MENTLVILSPFIEPMTRIGKSNIYKSTCICDVLFLCLFDDRSKSSFSMHPEKGDPRLLYGNNNRIVSYVNVSFIQCE